MARWATGAAFLAAILAAGGAAAQTAIQQLEASEAQIEARPEALSAAPSVQFTSQRAPANAGEILLTLSDIQVEGSTVYQKADFEAIYGGDKGREITLQRIFDIAGEIQGLYRNDDYVFTRVVVPAQDIEGGVVRLEVIEATIEAVTVEEPAGEIGPAKSLVEDMLSPLVGQTNPTGAFLERTLLNINEIPGVTRATAVPQAGTSGRGALALFINVERDDFEAVLFGDNRQVPGVGRGIFGGEATFNSWSEAGDTTTIAYFNSFGYLTEDGGSAPAADGGFGDFDERNTFQIEHERYVGTDGARVGGRVLYSRTRPGDDLAQVGIKGEQIVAGVVASYPLYRTRQVSLTGAIGADLYKSTTDVSNGVFRVADDRLRILYAQFDGLARDELGYWKFTIEGRQGLDIFNASDPVTDVSISRSDGQPDFSLIKAEVERLLIVNDDLNLFLRAGGQISATPLLASEEFAIGGLTFGRGFDPSEFTGDDGFGFSGEFRYLQEIEIEGFLFDAEFYAFGEYGIIWNKEQGQPQMEDIASAGGGVRLFLPEQYVLGLELAFPLDQPLARTADKDGRFFVNFSKQF